MTEPETENLPSLNVTANLPGLKSFLQKRLQIARDLAAFGFKASDSPIESGLAIPGLPIQVLPSGDRLSDQETLSAEFRRWVMASAFRDCSEALGDFLNGVQQVCALWYLFPSGSEVNAKELDEVLQERGQQFRKLPFPAKLKSLRKDYELVIPEADTEILLGFNTARRCLVHFQGLVQEDTKNCGDGLRVVWIEPQMIDRQGTGQEVVVQSMPHTSKGEVFIRNARQSKVTLVGERLLFSSKEFNSVVWTYMLLANSMMRSIEDYGRSLGVNIPEGT